MTFRNPFLTTDLAEHAERARRLQAAEAALVAAVGRGEVLDIDGDSSPLTADIRKKHGVTDVEMNRNWVLTPQSWTCPCCKRSKFDISRVGGESGRIVCKLVVHHDHMGDALSDAFRQAYVAAGRTDPERAGFALAERMGKAWAAHDDVLVCDDCNLADARAKKLVTPPRYFSFSPGQIATFIRPRPHQTHEIDVDAARRVWAETAPSLRLRMELIDRVAHAAATDQHWFEPFEGPGRADPTAHVEVSEECVVALTPPLRRRRTLTRWRTARWQPSPPLPENAVGLLLSNAPSAAAWCRVGDEWQCQCCQRSREETISRTKAGALQFVAHSTKPSAGWFSGGRSICSECVRLMRSLKDEISESLEWRPDDSYGFATVAEVRAIFTPSPNQPHQVRAADAEALVSLCVTRMRAARHAVAEAGSRSGVALIRLAHTTCRHPSDAERR